jgi:amidohydrolase
LNGLFEEICRCVDALEKTLSGVNRFIYEHPESALQERKAAVKLIDVLSANGFRVTAPAAGMETAFISTIGDENARPHIAFIAQYDALIDLGHACGHNLCAAASLGAALAAAAALPRSAGRISVVGTPSEEVLSSSGKMKMIAAGIFEDIDAALACHPHNRTWLDEKFLSINQIGFRFKGKSAHAGDTPHQGINAFDAVQLTFIGLSFLRQQLRQDARVHWGEVEINGPMNVIPDAASAKIGLRASDDSYTEEITRKAVDCLEGAALMTGCSPEYDLLRGYRSFKVNAPLVEELKGCLGKLGVPVDPAPAFGRGGSTDMGNISQVVPACYPLFKITDAGTPHSSAFMTAAGTEAAFQEMLKMTKALAAAGARCLTDSAFLKRVKNGFQE